MFAELSKLMNFSSGSHTEFDRLLTENILAKQTENNKTQTANFLKRLYLLDDNAASFRVFHYVWGLAPESDKPLLALLLALSRDFLLSESVDLIKNTSIGLKVAVNNIEDCIESAYPKRYTPKTLLSLSQNIASSWKQSGHITGRTKNIRTKINPGYHAVAFALFLGYLDNLRGDFLFHTKWIKVLDSTEKEIKALAHEAAKRDLVQFQFAGSVTVVNFNTLIKKLNLDGIEN